MENWNWNISNQEYLDLTIKRCQENKIILPTFEQMKKPETIPADIQAKLKEIDFQDTHWGCFKFNFSNCEQVF